MDFLADNTGISVVVSLPELITQDGYILRVLALGRIRWQQPAPQQHGHAKKVESVGSEIHSLNVFGKIALGRGEVPSIHGSSALDRSGLAKLLQLRSVEVYKTAISGAVVNRQMHHAV